MKTIAALFLASLLAVMAYGIFWLVCLNYTTAQLRDVVHEALAADLSFGTAQWVPDYTQVTMDLPAAKLTLPDGPVREIRAGNLRLSSGFLMRDRWTMALPERVEVLLANGKVVLLETDAGQVMWMQESNSLTLRAKKARLLDLNGGELMQVGDVMLERKASDNGVRINLASRPRFGGVEGLLSGQVVVPSQAFSNVLNMLGGGALPGVGDVLRTIASTLHASALKGDTSNASVELDNVSFKTSDMSGAVYGHLQVLPDGRVTGQLAVTADKTEHVVDWVQRAGLLAPRQMNEQAGAARFGRGLAASKATVSMENMQETLMLNGQPVGPLPQMMAVVSRLWP